MEWVLFLSVTVPGLFYIILAWYYNSYPPKSINYFYGYRTRRSMKNQDTWDYANRIGAKMFFWVGVSTLALGLLVYFISPIWAMFMSWFFLVVTTFVGIFWCERQLRINFDKKGQPLFGKDPSN